MTDKNQENNKKTPLIGLGTAILVVGTVLALFSPVFFTRALTSISYATTGQIGDTIGGLTAPVIGIMGAVLVFLALVAQVRANEQVQKQIKDQKKDDWEQEAFDSLFAIFRQVLADLDSVAIVRDESWGSSTARMTGEIQPQFVTYSGVRGLRKVLDRTAREHCARIRDEPGGDEFTYEKEFIWIQDVLGVFQILLQRLKTVELSLPDRETLTSLIKHLFQSRISNLLPSKCPACEEDHHHFPDDFCNAVESLRTNIKELDSIIRK